MQRSYSPADVSVCMPFWLNDGQALVDASNTVMTVRRHYREAEISLCDDGSPIPWYPRVTVARLPLKAVALNPCVAINSAVWHSTRPLVLLTNPGVEFRPGMIEAMIAALDDSTYVAAACRDVDTGRWLCHSTWRSSEQLPPAAGFHFLAMLERSLWDRAGGFDERYREGQAYEDADFLWRLHGAGATFKIVDDVVITHRRSTTVWPVGGLERNRALYRELRTC